ncbi:MAG TPA: O-antigen ligase family protein [Pyrinomonadaceae bacterium]|nr:O-antigen ligase family protein [Pyrinomonadaceae bacterium]
MTVYIILIPGIIALIYAIVRSPEEAFLHVYLPVLFFLPGYYRMILPGFPDPTFNEAAIIPIFLVYLARGAKGWRFTVTDLFVFGFAFTQGYSQYLSTGYNDAQNLIFDMLGNVVFPYIVAKGMIESSGYRVKFAKKLILVLAIVAVAQAYEFRFMACPFKMALDPFFPFQGIGWVTTIRYGFGRAAGPFGHCILAGLILGFGFRIQRWLQQNGHWESKRKAQVLTGLMVAGMLMSQARGPQLGAALGSVIVLIGRAKNRRTMLITVLSLGILVGTPAYIAFTAYVSVGRAGATSSTQETAAYRKELMDKYTDIALEKSWWGWGENEWPQVVGMPSIDNHFLNVALRHGLIAMGCFIMAMFWVAIRLAIYAYKAPPKSEASTLAFTLLAALIAVVIAIVTVYLGLQAQQVLFILIGWSDALVRQKEHAAVSGATTIDLPQPQFRFKRVLA